MKILIALIFLSGISAQVKENYGLILASPKAELVNDVLHILNTVLLNVKSYDNKDIIKEFKELFFLPAHKSISEIEAVSMDYDPSELRKSATSINSNGMLQMQTIKPILNYTFAFKWEIYGLFSGKKEGTGTVLATATNLEVRVSLKDKKLTSEVKADFNVKLSILNGKPDKDIKEMANGKLITGIKSGLNFAFDRNKDLISQYLFSTYINAPYNIHQKRHLVYHSIPVNWEQRGMYIITKFDTYVILHGTILRTNSDIIATNPEKKYITTLNCELIVMGMKAIHDNPIGFYINFEELGYSGKMKDFFGVESKWMKQYHKEAEVGTMCDGKIIIHNSNNYNGLMDFDCSFSARDIAGIYNEFMNVSTSAEFSISIVKDTEYMFTGEVINLLFHIKKTYPSTHNVTHFITNLQDRMRTKGVIQRRIMIPKLRYEPLRMYKDMEVIIGNSPNNRKCSVEYTY